MSLVEVTLAFAAVAAALLLWFWFAPGGVLALWRVSGERQVDVRLAYGPQTVHRLLTAYGDAGRRSFRRMLMIDMAFPLVYATTLYLAAIWLGAPFRHTAAIAQPAAVAAALSDYAENVLLLRVLARFPRRSDRTARLAGVATTLKMLAVVIAAAALAGASLGAA